MLEKLVGLYLYLWRFELLSKSSNFWIKRQFMSITDTKHFRIKK